MCDKASADEKKKKPTKSIKEKKRNYKGVSFGLLFIRLVSLREIKKFHRPPTVFFFPFPFLFPLPLNVRFSAANANLAVFFLHARNRSPFL